MENSLKPKIGIIGCGNVGMRYAYALILKGLTRSIVIVDPDYKRLEGEVMDLSHGAPYISPVEVVAGQYSDLTGADLIVITAGKKQITGQSRMELVRENIKIYRDIIPKIMRFAPSSILLIVTNPVDVLAYAAYKFSSKPGNEVLGSGTVLDTARFRYLLAKHCQIDPRNIHAYILGEHGDSEFPAWSNAMIGGILFKNYCSVCSGSHACRGEKELEEIFLEVRDSAYKIIERKGETSYGIGLSLVRITQAILRDENAVLPVSSLVQDYHGLNGIFLSLPAVLNKKGVRQILELEFSDTEKEQLEKSAQIIKKAIDQSGI